MKNNETDQGLNPAPGFRTAFYRLVPAVIFAGGICYGCGATKESVRQNNSGSHFGSPTKTVWLPLDEACVRHRWRCRVASDHVTIETKAGVFRFPLVKEGDPSLSDAANYSDVLVAHRDTLLIRKNKARALALYSRLKGRVRPNRNQSFERKKLKTVAEEDSTRKALSASADSNTEPPLSPERPVIVVDAGHGGKDPGAVSAKGVKEKDIVLDIAKRVSDLLVQLGYEVHLTRREDVFIPLAERVLMATQRKADAFISIHANAHPSSRIKGWEVYMVKDLDYDDINDPVRKTNEDLLFFDLKQSEDPQLKTIVRDLMVSARLKGGQRLAMCMTDALKQTLGSPSRDPMPSRFFVIRNTIVPSVLIEVGYLTNSEEHDKLMDPQYRQSIACAVVQGVQCYWEDDPRFPAACQTPYRAEKP